jgi:hypothetical protein
MLNAVATVLDCEAPLVVEAFSVCGFDDELLLG